MSLVRFRSEAPRKRPYAAACGRFSYVCGFRPCWPRGREIKASPAVVGAAICADELSSLRSANSVEFCWRKTRSEPSLAYVRLARSSCAERNSPRNPQRQDFASPTAKPKKDSKPARGLLSFFGRGRRTCLGCRLGRLVACVPPARTRPTTRTAQGAAVPRCRVLMRANEK